MHKTGLLLASLFAAYAILRHFISLDWPAWLRIGSAVALAIAFWCGWLHGWRHRQAELRWWKSRAPRARFGWSLLVLGLVTVLAMGLQQWPQPLRQTTLIIQVQPGAAVQFKGMYIDEQYIPLLDMDGGEPGWKLTYKTWQSKADSIASPLSWHGLAREWAHLMFQAGPNEGMVSIKLNGQEQVISLQEPTERIRVLDLPVAPPALQSGWKFRLLQAADVFLALTLAAFLLEGLRGMRRCFWQTKRKVKARASRRWGGRFLAAVLVLAGVCVSVVYVVDPLQFVRKAPYEPYWSVEQRYQNPGVAKNYNYDTVLLGTSTIENLRPEEMKPLLGEHSVKLALSAGSLYEQRLTLQLALRSQPVQTVYWGLDYMAFGGPADRVEEIQGPFPRYFYEQNHWSQWKYFFNYSSLKDSVMVLSDALKLRPAYHVQETLRNQWLNQVWFSRERVLQNYQKVVAGDFKDAPHTRKYYDAQQHRWPYFKNHIDTNLLPVIAHNPQTEFVLFLPPYTGWFYRAYWQQEPAAVQEWLLARSYLVRQASAYPNVRIFDFQSDPRFLWELDRYMDMLHSDKEMTLQIFEEMKQGKRQLTMGNVEEYNQELLRQLLRSDQ